MDLTPTHIGPYRVVRKLGEGGMGQVYEARHQVIGRQVAIKVLQPYYARSEVAKQRFVNEARAVNLISHPGIVQVPDFGQLADGSRYIVMEYLQGETLGARLRRLSGCMPVAQAIYICWQVASALAAVHEVGITHRDLKPDNIMLVPDPIAAGGERAKLLDFGIARLGTDSAEGYSLTLGAHSLTGDRIIGTPLYMSPEQCRGDQTVSAKSDVYSLGVVLYQLLAGRPPFVGLGAGSLISMHITNEPQPLRELAPDISAELAELVHQLLRKAPAERPHMLQVEAELDQLQTRPRSTGLQAPGGDGRSPPHLGISGEKLSDSLADILGHAIEDEQLPEEASDAAALKLCQVGAAEPRPSAAPQAVDAVPTHLLRRDSDPTLPLPPVGAAGPAPAAGTVPPGASSMLPPEGDLLGGRWARRQAPSWAMGRVHLMAVAALWGGLIATALWVLHFSRTLGPVSGPAVLPALQPAAVPPAATPLAAPATEAARPTEPWPLQLQPRRAQSIQTDTHEPLAPSFRADQLKGAATLGGRRTEPLLRHSGPAARPADPRRPGPKSSLPPRVEPPPPKPPDASTNSKFHLLD